MKQIIVNVSGLTIEEKQRVNEAMAKITGATRLPAINHKAAWFFAPAAPSGAMIVTWGLAFQLETPTHTPQQVLEMAGMAEKRKVRADFDPKQPISVDVSGCTEDEKKEVQQAFFDAGFPWKRGGEECQHLDAVQYSNATGCGRVTKFLMFGETTKECNMNREEFFSYVYEPVQQGHIHADLMALYAEDAKTTDKPWELWEFKDVSGEWRDLTCNPSFATHLGYRRKPKTKLIHGVEIPDIGIDLSLIKERTSFYAPCTNNSELFIALSHHKHNDRSGLSTLGLTYPYTEAGKQAAILHAKAWLGIA